MADEITFEQADDIRDAAIEAVEENITGIPHTARTEREERIAVARMLVLTGQRLLEEAYNAAAN